MTHHRPVSTPRSLFHPLFRSLSILTLVALGSALALAVPANGAELRSWHDDMFDKSWELTPTGEEVLLLFRPQVNESQRVAVALAEGLSESHAFNELYRTAVFRLPAGSDADAVAARLAARPEMEGAAPAVRDREGFVKYYVPGQLTVQFDKSLSDADCRARIAAAGSEVLEDYWTPGYYKIAAPEGTDLFAAIRDWYRHPDILFSEPIYMCYDDALHVPNDTYFVQQWALQNTQQQQHWTAGADVQAVEAWDLSKGSPNVIIAVIDTGMDLSHEDLAANLLPRNGEDWDFADPGDGSPDDTGDHGTACCGISAAVQDNSLGVSGIAPHCRLMPLRVNLSSGQNANRADAINYAASRRAEFDGLVMSCSWRMSSGDFTTVEAAVQNAAALDAVVCVATGNGNGAVDYPARYPETIAIGASSPCDERKSLTSCDGENFWGSNYGPEVDVVAPGVKIYTTDRTGSVGYSSGNYVFNFNGTSSATPLAAGICALIYSVNPNLTNDEVRQILRDSAEDQVGPPQEDTPGFDIYMGYGRVNAYQALQMAAVPESFEDDMESGEGPWTHLEATPSWGDPWHLSEDRNHTTGGVWSWKCGSQIGGFYAGHTHASLVSPQVIPPEGSQLYFWHWMDAETLAEGVAADGGVVEISTDNGSSWTTLTPAGGYSHTWGPNTLAPFTPGTPVWSGQFDWSYASVDLAEYVETPIRVRFRFGSRPLIPPGGGAEGWYIDDVTIAPLDPTSADEALPVALSLEVLPGGPNPFRGSTEVRFRLAERAPVSLRVSDVLGRSIVDRELGMLAAGEHRFVWDGRNADGSPSASGVYFVQVAAGDRTAGRRIVRIR